MVGWLACAALALSVTADEVVVHVADGLNALTVTDCPAPCEPERFLLEPDGARVLAFGSDRLLHDAPWLARLRRPGDVRFELPPGIGVSAPGTPLDAGATRFRLAGHPGGWRGVVAFGRFSARRAAVGAASLDVAVLDGTPPPDVDVLSAWVIEAARRVLLVHGDLPVPRVQVVVTPIEGREVRSRRDADPVPFGRVLRDGGAAVQLFVRQTATAAMLSRDWTATHEFSHLLLPYVERDDGWLPEGFATYYQNVLLARAGVYDAREAWQRIVEGFGRGRRVAYSDTLAESIARSGENHVMRMYWSGVAIALLADVELRRTGGSLDGALAGLRRHLPSDEPWSARRVIVALDHAGGEGVFDGLRRRWIDARDFPEVDAVLAALGVRIETGSVVLDDAAPLAAIRRAITSMDAARITAPLQ